MIINSLLKSQIDPLVSSLFSTSSVSADYDAAAIALFAAMPTQPDTIHKDAYNAYIVGLKADGLWPKCDVLTIHSAPDATGGCLNAVNPIKSYAQVNSPAFTPYFGFTGDGATSFLQYQEDLQAQTKYKQDDATQFVFTIVTLQTAAQDISALGNNGSSIVSRSAGNIQVRANVNTADLIAPTVSDISPTLTAWSRNNSLNFDVYKNGVFLANVTRTSTGVAPGALAILRGAAAFSTRQIAISGVASSFTATDHANLNTRTRTFLTAIGAI